jgi:eukaryotic-like serine/threonine-protein kinase
VAHDPSVFHEPGMALAARDLAVALDREGKGDRLFDALTNRLGSDGLDVLYDLVATKGRAGAAVRAGTVLHQKDVLARATPEMRVAFALREASCVDKLGLLDRAAAEGDGRALVVLQTQGVACFKKNNRAVQEAMTALRARLHRGQ